MLRSTPSVNLSLFFYIPVALSFEKVAAGLFLPKTRALPAPQPRLCSRESA
ncbi:hypothetical protein HMPREF0281_01813 [Corynebacterium ammoniagenes DSM 20306]|uniref:Uncharacterized protein n=1 Tax=Corynebacterium ammoniagenes DSM 20306 TaxID=649754 RepID=A0ABP2IBK5_CORAM|nr:hypothetical protein HMPREF0281_01813 [Corynebacterium ammoniagenes DSM 20306]